VKEVRYFVRREKNGLRKRDQAVSKTADEIAGLVAAAMRRADENDAPHKGQRMQNEERSKFILLSVGESRSITGIGADDAPEEVSGVNGGALGQETALAVADNDHVAQSGIVSAGIELSQGFSEGVTQLASRDGQWVTAAVDKAPKLEMTA